MSWSTVVLTKPEWGPEKNPESAPPWFQWETSCDPNRFMSGWTPKYTIESGTADYLNYLKKMNNDLEVVVTNEHPKVNSLKNFLMHYS